MSPELSAIRDKIFAVNISDIQVASDLRDEPVYPKLVAGLSNYSRAPTQEELKFIVRYKNFIDTPEVYSMAGNKEIEQMYTVMLNVIANGVKGDLVETGVWRGGMGMWMKALIDYYKPGDDIPHYKGINRRLWLFDSFESFPEPASTELPDNTIIDPDEKDINTHNITKVMYDNPPTVYEVRDSFQKFGLLDDSVKLVKGLFSDTFPAVLSPEPTGDASLSKIAILRIDNDYYDSVRYVLERLYPHIEKGGYIIIDDYNNPALGCKKAVDEFREEYGIDSPIVDKYKGSIYWQV